MHAALCLNLHTLLPPPPQGYLLYSFRRKLKAELVGRSQAEIRALRTAGEEVTDTYQVGGRGLRVLCTVLRHNWHKRCWAAPLSRAAGLCRQRDPALPHAPSTHTCPQIPEVAFTGDTSGALFEDPATPADVYKAKLLIVELTFLDDSVPWEQVRFPSFLAFF